MAIAPDVIPDRIRIGITEAQFLWSENEKEKIRQTSSYRAKNQQVRQKWRSSTNRHQIDQRRTVLCHHTCQYESMRKHTVSAGQVWYRYTNFLYLRLLRYWLGYQKDQHFSVYYPHRSVQLVVVLWQRQTLESRRKEWRLIIHDFRTDHLVSTYRKCEDVRYTGRTTCTKHLSR